MSEYITTLERVFKNNANAKIALEQKAYMRHQFEYYGLKTNERRDLQKPFLVKTYLPPKNELEPLIKMLWEKPQREFQYFSQELVFLYIKQLEINDIVLFEYMVTHKSWWDTIDFIANKLIGAYFKRFPDQRKPYVQKWLDSNNMWLQRSALLFQLKYKTQLDTQLLSHCINSLLGTTEFFINKAIGWILREYSRTDPDWVKAFASKTTLSPLSKREALKLLN